MTQKKCPGTGNQNSSASARNLKFYVIIQYDVWFAEQLHNGIKSTLQHGYLSRLVWIRSRLKIPIIDFASITYLPDTKSKSQSNLLISLTNDFHFINRVQRDLYCFHYENLP